MRFKVRTYHNQKDFVFGTWQHEHHSDGGMTVRGRLKKNGNVCKYMDVYRCD